MEAAPATVNPSRLRSLREAGVTRISLGAQSFNPRILEAMGRMHTPTQIFRAYDLVREAGFASVNLDLIFAVPGQTRDDLLLDLETATSLSPDHLSTYCLTFEEDTALYVRLSEGRVHRDPANEADLYEAGWRFLEAAGFEQYEISNFSRPGHHSRHNCNTWDLADWIGYGPSAASQIGLSRFTNTPDLDRWRSGVEQRRPQRVEQSTLSPRDLAIDRLVLRIRTSAGITPALLADPALGEPEHSAISRWIDLLIHHGLAERRTETTQLTLEGRLVADAVATELLASLPAPGPEPASQRVAQ